MNHTPGPWKYGALVDDSNHYYIKAGVYWIAEICGGTGQDTENAHLIAAAPDLLAACEAALAGLEETIHMRQQREQLKAAIAKARGESCSGAS